MRTWIGDGATGSLVERGEAVVSVFDHGFTVGDGVFETLKVVRGVPFALSRHLERLTASARTLGAVLPDLGHVREAVAMVIAANTEELGELARLRITWTSGSAPLGSDRADVPPTLVVATMRQQPWPPTTSAITIPGIRNPRSLLAGAKSTSYAENVVALARAHAAGASEAILGTVDGLVSEGTGSNVVLVLDGEAITPTLASGCLPGITRALVIAWLGVVERDVPLEALAEASEVMLVSSTRDVHPVTWLDGRECAPGPIGARMREEFTALAATHPDP